MGFLHPQSREDRGQIFGRSREASREIENVRLAGTGCAVSGPSAGPPGESLGPKERVWRQWNQPDGTPPSPRPRPGPAHPATAQRAPPTSPISVQKGEANLRRFSEAFFFLLSFLPRLPSQIDTVDSRPQLAEYQHLCCDSCREGNRGRPGGASPTTHLIAAAKPPLLQSGRWLQRWSGIQKKVSGLDTHLTFDRACLLALFAL